MCDQGARSVGWDHPRDCGLVTQGSVSWEGYHPGDCGHVAQIEHLGVINLETVDM